ncbi:hypothetical protein V6N11_070181 [Hibiscus sabdariffa]|uniref:Secreted protein n=1 Tax=Hibiscus sabdariffa TaxID=183260 RepID=A0ABR2QER2_9ROSI
MVLIWLPVLWVLGFGLANGEGWGPVSEWLVRAVVADATGGGCELDASVSGLVGAWAMVLVHENEGDDELKKWRKKAKVLFKLF